MCKLERIRGFFNSGEISIDIYGRADWRPWAIVETGWSLWAYSSANWKHVSNLTTGRQGDDIYLGDALPPALRADPTLKGRVNFGVRFGRSDQIARHSDNPAVDQPHSDGTI
jgi:hypothetical protein